MKKFISLIFFVLYGCTQMQPLNELSSSAQTSKTLSKTRQHNENCMDMTRFQVFQVFDDSYALANACMEEWDYSYCNGAVVLLTPQRNIEYYDEMYVSAPNNKCAVQNGVYKYETKSKNQKTVPVIRFEYEFSSLSEEEKLERFTDKMEDLRYECKLSVTNNKKQNTKANLNKCDCIVNFITSEFISLKDSTVKEEIEEDFSDRLEKKCGKIPDFMK